MIERTEEEQRIVNRIIGLQCEIGQKRAEMNILVVQLQSLERKG